MSYIINGRNVPSYWLDFDIADPDTVRASTFVASDGVELICYDMGEETAPILMLVNPIHMPFLAQYRVACSLARFYRVISYETRGSAFLPDYLSDVDASLLRQSRDLAEIAAHFGNAGYFLGWCNSAKVIAWCTENKTISPKAIVLIAPSGTAGEEGQHLQRGTLFGPLESLNDQQVERARKALAQAIEPSTWDNSADSDLIGRLFGLNFIDGPRFRHYVRMKLLSTRALPSGYTARRTFDVMCDASRVLLIRPELDEYIAGDHIQSVVERKPSVSLYTLRGAGHAPTLSHWQEISDATLKFLSSSAERSSQTES
jgi:pimeloyl-ACP methyl ester carboxylesterase